jgi:hypothetical protein
MQPVFIALLSMVLFHSPTMLKDNGECNAPCTQETFYMNGQLCNRYICPCEGTDYTECDPLPPPCQPVEGAPDCPEN